MKISALAGVLAGAFQLVFASSAYNAVEEAWVYVRVVDAQGQPVRGLLRDDFTLLVDGHQPRILDCVELGTDPERAGEGLHIVLHFDPRLDFREQFRSRRAALSLIEAMNPQLDAAAVLSQTALSGFTNDPIRMRRLLLYFGDLGDRYGLGSPYPGPPRWKRRWPTSLERSRAALALPRDFADEVDQLYLNGVFGDLSSTLTRFKGLPGRKVLFYFGRDVPYQDDRLERHDPRFAARTLSDSGFTVAAFNPSGTVDWGTARLREWARATGGFAESHGGDFRQAVRRALSLLRHGYRLTYQRPVQRNCRFREVLAAAACGQCRTLHPDGDFATVDAPLSWTERTLLTTALHESDFQDFPVDVTASLEDIPGDGDGVGQPRRVEVSAAFPFAVAGDAEAMVRMANSGVFRQRVLFLMAVYDQDDRLLGEFQGTANFEMKPAEAAEALTQRARLDRSIPLTLPGAPATVRVIVVIGENRLISMAATRLHR